MKERIKYFLEKWPALYSFVAKGYARFRYLEVFLLGTRVKERQWATRHLRKGERRRDDWGKGSNDGIKGYRDSRNHLHRPFLIEAISKFNPSSILEIGCNCGPNLYLLAKKFPDAEIIGIDINPVAVQKGNEWFAQEGISNIKLLESKADELEQFHDKSFDVVFTWAVLILVRLDKIKEVMKEMIRITRKRLIILEMYGKDKNKGLGFYHGIYWKRDYVALLRQFIPDFPEDKIHITKFPEDLWNPGGGGTLVEFITE